MDLHKPKPWHNVREFLKEYVIIVVGVLTALAFEQAVEWLHWQESVASLRGVLHQELAHDRGRWDANRSADACTETRLNAILDWAHTAPPGAIVTHAGTPPYWNLHLSVWDMAKTNPGFAHLPISEQMLYAELYSGMGTQQANMLDERALWLQTIALLEQGDRAEDKAALRRLVVDERNALTRRRFNYDAIFKLMDHLGVHQQPLPESDQKAATTLCAPLVAAPAKAGG